MNCCWRAVLMSSSVTRCAKNLHCFRCLQTPQKSFFAWVLDFALTAVISKISTYLLPQTTIETLPYGQARWTILPIALSVTIGRVDFHHTKIRTFFHSSISPTQSSEHPQVKGVEGVFLKPVPFSILNEFCCRSSWQNLNVFWWLCGWI